MYTLINICLNDDPSEHAYSHINEYPSMVNATMSRRKRTISKTNRKLGYKTGKDKFCHPFTKSKIVVVTNRVK